MKRSLKEKLAHNRQKKTSFASGYVTGVILYSDYPKGNSKDKKTITSIIDNAKELARMGDESCKGIMCGYRDAANERKSKKK